MVRQGKETDKETLMLLWKYCFPEDSNRFIRFYFDNVYTNAETLVYTINDRPIASLQMIPYRIKIDNSFLWGGYISGAMTHPYYQRKGYMQQLLTTSFDNMRRKGYTYTFLIPQEEHLFDYYRKFGYENAFPEYSYQRCQVKPILSENVNIYTDFDTVNFPALYSVYSCYLVEKENVVLKSELQFSNILWNFFDETGVLFANDKNFAFTFNDKDAIILIDFFYWNEDTKTELLQTINAYYSGTKVIIFPDSSVPTIRYKGMIKSLNKSTAAKTNIYMGRM